MPMQPLQLVKNAESLSLQYGISKERKRELLKLLQAEIDRIEGNEHLEDLAEFINVIRRFCDNENEATCCTIIAVRHFESRQNDEDETALQQYPIKPSANGEDLFFQLGITDQRRFEILEATGEYVRKVANGIINGDLGSIVNEIRAHCNTEKEFIACYNHTICFLYAEGQIGY